VTHLPQVAARADRQWQVSKVIGPGGAISSIQVLDDGERVREIARMLGGVDISDIALEHAREMLRSTPVEG
jgi:DNA repair protein RecN (Recombination protein N)